MFQWSLQHEIPITTGETVLEERTAIHPVLIGGDQLTAARARAAIRSKENGPTTMKQHSGLVPVVEDWHAKANFLQN